MGLAGTLMNTLALTSLTNVFCEDYIAATAQLDELARLAEKKGSLYWKAFATWLQGWLLALTGKASEAVEHTYLWRCGMAINGGDAVCANAVILFG